MNLIDEKKDEFLHRKIKKLKLHQDYNYFS
jgi:hypothetical protein